MPEQKSLTSQYLISPDRVFLLPLHIKYYLVNVHVKGMGQSDNGCLYFKQKFKIKDGIFIGPKLEKSSETRWFVQWNFWVKMKEQLEGTNIFSYNICIFEITKTSKCCIGLRI